MFLTLRNQEEKETVYQIVLEIEKEETSDKYIVCHKVNYDDPAIYLKLIESNGMTSYEEIDDDEEYYHVDQVFEKFLKEKVPV
ncbi:MULTISPECIES: DUF1292 domain-containing protein [Bacillota]|uniref:DUF1292 domain-containing protein n=1 Tax=Bacillota TaxID=1239 RepID=UPI0039F0345F